MCLEFRSIAFRFDEILVPRSCHTCTNSSSKYVHEMMWDRLEYLASASDYKLYEPKDANDSYLPRKVKLDKDDPHHMTWIYERALERAAKFKIEGVTYKLSMQVVKNIIPAIASTNAIIAASCVTEGLKALTGHNVSLSNFMFFVHQRLSYV
jgi:hypothetical protein